MKFKKLKGTAPVFMPFIILYCFWIAICIQQLAAANRLEPLEYISWIFGLLWGIFAVTLFIIVIIDCNSEYIISEDGVTYEPKLGKRRHISWEDCGMIGICGAGRGLSLFFSPERYVCYTLGDCNQYVRKNRRKIIAVRCTPGVMEGTARYAPRHLAFSYQAMYENYLKQSYCHIQNEKRKKKRAMRLEYLQRKQTAKGHAEKSSNSQDHAKKQEG